jgi:hypothetical protein
VAMWKKAFFFLAAACLAFNFPGRGWRSARAQSQTVPGIQREPHLVVDKDNNLLLAAAVGTSDAAGRQGAQILFTRSVDGGANWDNKPLTRNLSNSPINAVGALFPRIAVTKTGKTRVYLVYDDDTAGPRQAYCVRSSKNTNFKRSTLLSSGSEGGLAPVIDTDLAGTVNVAWAGSINSPRQIVFARSTDQGVTFSQPVNVSDSTGEAFDPAIAIGADDAINLAWEDTGTGIGQIFFSRSTDAGASFSIPRQVSAALAEASDVEIATDSQGRISVAWIEEQPAGGTRITISTTSDGGGTFSSPLVVISGQEAEFEYLAMVARGNTIYLAYGDDDVQQVYLTQSRSDLLTFSKPLQLSNAEANKGEAKSPSLAVDGNGRIHVVWIDTSILGGDHGLVVYRSSSDGQSFTPPVLVPAFVQSV